MKRPTIKKKPTAVCVDGETIIEFAFPDGSGGLISFRTTGVGYTVDIYRTDKTVKVFVPEVNRS